MHYTNETFVDMDFVGDGLYIATEVWSVVENSYRIGYLTFDTGSSVTVLEPEVFEMLGYKPIDKKPNILTTASKVEQSPAFLLEKIKIGDFEIFDVEAHSLEFPIEGFSAGVIGLNVLRHFDIELLFSKGIIKLKKL